MHLTGVTDIQEPCRYRPIGEFDKNNNVAKLISKRNKQTKLVIKYPSNNKLIK